MSTQRSTRSTTTPATKRAQAARVNREDELLEFVRTYQKKNGYSPSYDEIREALGFKSKGSIFNMMRTLADEGRVSYTRGRARTLRIV